MIIIKHYNTFTMRAENQDDNVAINTIMQLMSYVIKYTPLVEPLKSQLIDASKTFGSYLNDDGSYFNFCTIPDHTFIDVPDHYLRIHNDGKIILTGEE